MDQSIHPMPAILSYAERMEWITYSVQYWMQNDIPFSLIPLSIVPMKT